MIEVVPPTDGSPVPATVIYFLRGNDMSVVARFPTIADGTGYQGEFYYKTDRATPDTDPTTIAYAAPIVADPDNTGATMSTFQIDAADNGINGAFWWRVDVVDPGGLRSTVGFGTLLVEAVLWSRKRNTPTCLSSCLGTGLQEPARQSFTGVSPATSMRASQRSRSM